MMNFPSRLQTSFLAVIAIFVLVNMPVGRLLFSDVLIANLNAFLMLLFVSMWLLFGSVYIKGHQAYDNMEDLYSQTEGERILILSKDGPW
ncbi:MAG: hypothetical protein ACC656_02620 [Candidatus Heimdallarchaeota archaeon]